MKSFLLALALAAVVCGCATQPVRHVPEITQSFSTDTDRVWIALVQELTGKFTFDLIDKSSGLIQTKQMSVPQMERYATPPMLFLPIWSNSRAVISVNVIRKNANETDVRIIGRFEGYESNAAKAWYTWHSNGELEKSILAGVAQRVATTQVSAAQK